MAEALLEWQAGERVQAFSAGSHPRPLRPRARKALRRYGIELSGHEPRAVGDFASRRLEYVVTLCDKVREVLPEFTYRPVLLHWSIPNPDDEGGDVAFRRTAAELDTRIRFLVPALN
jgi:ArsR family transcriptional regulator, arsenate/arsenite/antimonite-responsive transcriptional repressor / arsenate reductase (thioredoxin)